MRDRMMVLWRKMTKIKALLPVVRIIRYVAGSRIFNEILDFCEVNIFKTVYAEEAHYFQSHQKEIRSVLESLCDSRSRHIYRQLWLYRITHHRKYIRGLTDREQYFDGEIIQLGGVRDLWTVDHIMGTQSGSLSSI